MARVALEEVSKVYPGNVRAVTDLTLHVEDGRFVVMVGPSGCGKSTTLRMVAGLEEITSGTISIGDRVVNDLPPRDRDVAMVFQEYALYPHMTVFENMAFGLRLRRLPKREINGRVREAASMLGLSELLRRHPRQLSGGERQRVAVGRAIVRKPAVFLFDEPLSNLDATMRVQMRVEIRRLQGGLGQTMLYVTHDQSEALTMGDTVVVMKDGVVQQVAEPGELYEKPANMFVAGFIGTPPMNLFRGALRSEGERLLFDGTTFAVPLPDSWRSRLETYGARGVVLGLRPQDIQPQGPGGAGDAHITGCVDVAESVGSETYVYITSGSHEVVSRVNAGRRYEPGAELTLRLDMSRAHLFELETEQAII